jgi:hypothetical protein
MSRAVFLMSNKQDRFSSHIYEECKINHIKLLRHPHPQEWNDNKSKALKGRIINDEWRQKLSIAAKNRGMGHIDNTGRKLSQETKTKISTQVKSRKWWNNGVVDKMCPDCPGEGWVRGRLYTQRQNKRRSAT